MCHFFSSVHSLCSTNLTSIVWSRSSCCCWSATYFILSLRKYTRHYHHHHDHLPCTSFSPSKNLKFRNLHRHHTHKLFVWPCTKLQQNWKSHIVSHAILLPLPLCLCNNIIIMVRQFHVLLSHKKKHKKKKKLYFFLILLQIRYQWQKKKNMSMNTQRLKKNLRRWDTYLSLLPVFSNPFFMNLWLWWFCWRRTSCYSHFLFAVQDKTRELFSLFCVPLVKCWRWDSVVIVERKKWDRVVRCDMHQKKI